MSKFQHSNTAYIDKFNRARTKMDVVATDELYSQYSPLACRGYVVGTYDYEYYQPYLVTYCKVRTPTY